MTEPIELAVGSAALAVLMAVGLTVHRVIVQPVRTRVWGRRGPLGRVLALLILAAVALAALRFAGLLGE